MTTVTISAAAKRKKMREECKNFLWGMWLMLFLAVSMGYESFQGMRTGQWVDLGKLDDLRVPWWIAAPLALCVGALSVCCLVWHLQLRAKLKGQRADDEVATGG